MTNVADADVDRYLETARSWLAANAPEFEDARPTITKSPALSDAEHAEVIARARAWEARKAAAGYAGISLPVELGGAGRSPYEDLAFAEAESHFRLPHDVMIVTKGMVVPTLVRWATPELQHRFVPPAISGRELWCQMFSEPGAGSDLAAIGTRAIPVEGGFRLRGQKVWTSYAADADYGYVLARTDPDVAKHRGLTAFLLDMDSDGVDVRPLGQATGGATFAEVFLDEVFVPASMVLGETGQGWEVALTTLMNERVAIGASAVPWPYLAELLTSGAVPLGDAALDEAMQIYTIRLVLELLKQKGLDAVREQREPGPESAASKILAARGAERSAALANRLMGGAAIVDGPWPEYLLGIAGLKVGGGTEDILKSVLGERVLGLPAEPRMDRGRTWAELKRAHLLN